MSESWGQIGITQNAITENFGLWIIREMFDDLGRYLQSGNRTKDDFRNYAKVHLKRINQLMDLYKPASWEFIAYQCDYEISYIRMIATTEKVYDVI